MSTGATAAAGGWVPRGHHPRQHRNHITCIILRMYFFWFCRLLALAAAVAGVIAAPFAFGGDPWSWAWRPGDIALGVHLDLISSVLVAFVGVLSWVVLTYSLTNLRGRAGLGRLGATFAVVLVGLLATVSGASLVVVAAGWTISGLAVASLVGRVGTPQATAAAALTRRTLLIGDACLWAGVVAGLMLLPSLDRARLGEIGPGWETTLVGMLLVGACIARSALVPAHRWLPETAEAPSPVSALLHAGVVNGAGVLVLVCWPLFSAAPVVLAVLVVVGAASVALGALAVRIRADDKGRLACSTTSQMGYMCVQLGLGLPAVALMHLVGHGSYKAWLFLRAGGAVGRARSLVVPTSQASWARTGSALLAAGVAAIIALPAAMILIGTVGITVLVPVLIGVFAAGLAGYAVSGLDRVERTQAWSGAGFAGVLAGGYVWALLGVEKVFERSLGSEPVWGLVVGSVLVAFVVVVGVGVALGVRTLEADPDGSLMVWLLPTALAPSGRRPAGSRVRVPERSPGSGPPDPLPIDEATMISAVEAAAAVAGPAWPLRNMVAANPLARLEGMAFDDAVQVAQRAYGVSGRASLHYYLDLHTTGRITEAHLQASLAEQTTRLRSWAVNDFTEATQDLADVHRMSAELREVGWGGSMGAGRRYCDAVSGRAGRLRSTVDEHAALWTQRAWASTSALLTAEQGVGPEPAGPWQRWRSAASRPAYDRAVGIRGAAAAVRELPLDPAAALSVLATWMELPAERLVGYLAATFASAPGWTGHAAWRARRAQDPTPLVELAALRMAHDVVFSAVVSGRWPAEPLDVIGLAVEQGSASDSGQDPTARLTRVWQRALEIGVEDWLLSDLNDVASSSTSIPVRHVSQPNRPISQSIWCIDVRSERVRRHLEALGHHETYGFAGFFGAAVEHRDADGIGHECCPALIEPSFTAWEAGDALTVGQVWHRTVTAVSAHPLGALAIAESGGLLSATSSITAELDPRVVRGLNRWWIEDAPTRIAGQDASPRLPVTARSRPRLHSAIGVRARADMAAAALGTIGLTGGFARFLLVCAHGASIENNAFASAYDCGACGGNSGLANAVLLVDALNDPQVRAVLAEQGITLPRDTVAVAAIHDTTTDQVQLLPGEDLDADTLVSMDTVRADLRLAGQGAARDRHATLPDPSAHVERGLARRAADWSEPTPEWGLAGNAAIVFGPRSLTQGKDLFGRVFLHSYDRDTDPEGAVLEQLLNAPLVVAQWINAQYYFSAVEPEIFGAGDKTTHNVVGDVGVLQGAHGDLRSGLPWQALFRYQPGSSEDITSLAHEPVRLLAVVAADPALVVDIITRHEVLRRLVGNQWISLICVDRGRTIKLGADLAWQPWQQTSSTNPVTYRCQQRPPVAAGASR